MIDETHTCPRCAYELSGETSRWSDSCPLRGRCPECGLEFEWAAVLTESRRRLDGLVEHSKGVGQFFAWSWRTWRLTLKPWRFWSVVELHHDVRVPRLLLWLALVLPVMHLINAKTTLAWYQFGSVLPSAPGWHLVNPFLHPVVAISGDWADTPYVFWMIGSWPRTAWWLLLFAPLWPVALLVMPISLRRARVRWAHVARAAVYSVSVPALYFVIQLGANLATIVRYEIGPRIRPAMWHWDLDMIGYVRELLEQGLIVLGIPWLAAWWYFTLTRGWKLRHGWAVWLALVVLIAAALITMVGVQVTFGGRTYRI